MPDPVAPAGSGHPGLHHPKPPRPATHAQPRRFRSGAAALAGKSARPDADELGVSRYVLGIDLGTVNSCVAVVKDGQAVVLRDGKDNIVPSCLSLQRGKEVVGHAARRQAVTDPHNTIIAVKRILGHPFESAEVKTARERMPYKIRPSPLGDVLIEVGGKELTPIQISARILQRVKSVAEEALGTTVDRAVISVPAHFNDVQRKATKQAAEYAGLRVLRLINEPTAAAFAYGYKKGGKFTLAVYDLGGGTFDITVMQARGDTLQVKATDGDSYLGGEDFDHAVAEWLIEEFKREFGHDLHDDKATVLRLREAAEKAKIELSSVAQARIELPFVAQLPDGTRPTFVRTLDASKFKELIEPLVRKTLDLCERCLRTAGIPRGAIDEVLLVGGQSRTRAVRDAVQLFFGKEPRRDINPDEVVAVGAALYAYSLAADDLAAEASAAAEDDYAVAVKQTAIAEKILNDVQRKIDRVATGDHGLRSRLASLLADLGPSTSEPSDPSGEIGDSMPDLEVSPSQSGGKAKGDPDAIPGFEASPSQGGADPEFALAIDFDDATAPSPKPQASLPTPKKDNTPARSQLPTKPPARTKPAPAASSAAARSQLETRVAPPPTAAKLPSALSDIKQKLSGMGDIAQEVLDALADEIADEKGSDELADEAARLSKQLAETVSSGRRAATQAETALREAGDHQNARRVELIDVTSHSLGIGAAADVMTVVIEHNTSVPAEQERIFTTNQDGQTEVEIRVYQGREKRASRNQLLGNFVLEGIPPARRMEPKIAVRFRIDADGILSVRAHDPQSGVEQAIRIEDALGLQKIERPDENAPPGS
jgi:molecular chaperone DnaK (HSP70)